MHNRLRNKNILAVPASVIAALGMTACGGGETQPTATVTVTPTETASPTATEAPTAEPTPEVTLVEDMESVSAQEFADKYTAESLIMEKFVHDDIPMDQFQLKGPELENESTQITAIVANLDARDAMAFKMGTFVPDSHKDIFRDKANETINGSTDPVWAFTNEASEVVNINDFIRDNYPQSPEADLPEVSKDNPFASDTEAFLLKGFETFTPKYGHYALSTSAEDNKIAENYQVNAKTDLNSVEWDITKAGSLTISGQRDVYDNIAQGEPDKFFDNPSATSYSWKVTGKIDQSTNKVTIDSRQITDLDPEGTNMDWPGRQQ